MLKAPWPDYTGNPIHHGDTLVHPADTSAFIAVCLPDNPEPTEAWRAIYSDGRVSRLCLQIGDKGRATVVPNAATNAIDLLRETRDELLWWIDEHGCCAGHEGDLIDRIDAVVEVNPSAAAPRS